MASIKTQVMETIKVALQSLPIITAVHRIPEINPSDTDTLSGNIIFFYDETERRQRDGRLASGVLSLMIITYVPITVTNFEGATDACDDVQVEIHRAMTTLAETGLPLITKMIEGDVQKDYPNDVFVVLTQAYEVTYSHKWGDGNTQANY
jgi:hypothetical protein